MQSVMQQFGRPETRIGNNKPRLSSARFTAGVVALVLLAGACTSDDPADFSIDDGAQTPATGSGSDQGADDDGSGDTGGDDSAVDDTTGVGSDNDGSDNDGNDSNGNDGGPTEPPLIEGVCGIDQVNRQPFYAVANIEDDDPDGGLNIRDNFEAGEKLATVAEGDVVYVEDCYRRDDGSAWYAVETADGINGWANSAYLSDVISPFEPTFGGVETAGMVEDLLDTLASREWEEAAEMFIIPDVPSVPIAALLDDPPAPDPDSDANDEDADTEEPTPLERLTMQLEAYCDVRICDAPYRIDAVRGSYVPRRFGPEVDVSFTYSGGIVTETFRRLAWVTESGDDVFMLDTLPGQSVLAFKLSQPSADELVTNPDEAPVGLLEAAEAVRRSLLSESGPRIDSDFVPRDGIAISTSAYVEPSANARPVITGQDLRAPDGEPRIWGYRDGVGTPIVDTVEGQLAGYRRAPALLAPDEVAVDERIGRGNTIANLPEVFSAAHTVEFHRRGRGDLADFAWSSVRMAFERQGRDWKLVAITSDTWTI